MYTWYMEFCFTIFNCRHFIILKNVDWIIWTIYRYSWFHIPLKLRVSFVRFRRPFTFFIRGHTLCHLTRFLVSFCSLELRAISLAGVQFCSLKLRTINSKTYYCSPWHTPLFLQIRNSPVVHCCLACHFTVPVRSPVHMFSCGGSYIKLVVYYLTLTLQVYFRPFQLSQNSDFEFKKAQEFTWEHILK